MNPRGGARPVRSAPVNVRSGVLAWLAACASDTEDVCRSAARPELPGEPSYGSSVESALAKEEFDTDVEVTSWRCGPFAVLAVYDAPMGTNHEYFLEESGQLVAGFWGSDVPQYCGGTYARMWALPGLWSLPAESCPPECFLLGTGEPACRE
jgi:hypothetical protein